MLTLAAIRSMVHWNPVDIRTSPDTSSPLSNNVNESESLGSLWLLLLDEMVYKNFVSPGRLWQGRHNKYMQMLHCISRTH